MIQGIKQDHKDALNALIKVYNDNTHYSNICLLLLCKLSQEPIHDLTKEEQFDKAAQATVNNSIAT